MAKKTFTPIIGDLEHLSEKERVDYVLAVCDFLNIPPQLGVVGLRWMDSGDGKRSLVLYIEKGGTDIIRGDRGIDVDTLDEANGDGYVGWKVRGHDKTGRHEIAVGTVTIEGLKGKFKADAPMKAQTKSLRRMTLQFAGGGFLDVAELDEKTTDIANSASSLQLIAAQPSITPNTAAGKDVTISEVPSKTESATAGATSTEPIVAKESEQETVKGHESTAAKISGPPPSSSEISPVKRPRGRPRKVVSLDTPISTNVETSNSVAQPADDALGVTQVPEQEPGEAVAVAPVQPAIPVSDTPKEVEGPSDGGMIPTPEQRMAYTKRLSVYVNDTLPKGGFLQSEKLGGRNDQMMKFFNIIFPQVNRRNMSIQQWDDYFELMDTKLTELGEKGLVQFIYEKIDPKKESANA